MKNVARFDRGNVQGDAVITDEGYIRANAIVTRTGIFNYMNSDGSIRRELRHPEDIWEAESISSMELIPVTNGHPNERMITAENYKRLAVGFTGETIKKNGEFVTANMVITDHEAVNAVKNHNRRELSLGYLVDIDETPGIYLDQEYDARQRNVRYNHLAIVDKARAGPEARIALDADDAQEIKNEGSEMAKRKIKIDNEEVFVEEQTANHIQSLEDNIKNLNDEIDSVKSELSDQEDELESLKKDIEKLEAERDSIMAKMNMTTSEENNLENKITSNMDSDRFKKAVNERIKLYQFAEKSLGEEMISKLDSMNTIDIKKAIISECRKSIKLDGKSSIYVEAMFDTIVDEIKNDKKVNCDNVSIGRKDSQTTGHIAVDARAAMIQRHMHACK